MKLIKYLRKLLPTQFYDEVKDKTSIFLHHTAGGGALEAIEWWNQTPERVGTALLVDRDGNKWQCFEINRWAYHLGVSTGTGKTTRQSVGIEIVSYGFLFKEKDKLGNDQFVAYPLWPNKSQRKVIPTDDVCTLDKEWRGFKYYQKYTDEQVESVIELCRYLVDRFKIKVQDLTNFWEYNPEVIKKDLPGIWSHTSVRPDGKWDIFPQPNLIEGLYKEFGTKIPTKSPNKPCEK